MSLIGSVSNAVKTVVQKTEQASAGVKAKLPEAPPSPARPRDVFQSLPRPKVDLGAVHATARADASGVHASLAVHGKRLAAVGATPTGFSVSDVNSTVGATPKGGVGVSTRVLDQKVGVHFKQDPQEAMLGGINLKLGEKEVTVGLTPAAPMPLPLPNYVGPVRDDEEV